MNNDKYVGMDVHLATVVVAVLNAAGKCVMESVIETKGGTVVEFVGGLSGAVHMVFEEGTQSTRARRPSPATPGAAARGPGRAAGLRGAVCRL